MVCCSSAPPTTLRSLDAESTGHVVGATRQTLGLRASEAAPAAGEPGDAVSVPSGSEAKWLASYISFINPFEVLRRLLDAGVRSHPALLLRGDLVVVDLGLDDGLRDQRRLALGDHLARRPDVLDVGRIGAHH